MVILAYILIVVGGLVSLINWTTPIASWRSKRFVSPAPFGGALLLGVGLLLLPETRPFAWVALIADFGTLVFIIAIPRLVWIAWATSRFNLVHAFAADTDGRAVTIKLFCRQIAEISVKFDPPILFDDGRGFVNSFGLVGSWSPTTAGFVIKGYDSDRELRVLNQGGRYVTAELNYPGDRKSRHDSLDGIDLHPQPAGGPIAVV